MAKKPTKPLPAYDILPKVSYPKLYATMERLWKMHHRQRIGAEGAECKIAMARAFKWKENPDGQMRLGHTRILSELDRQLTGFDVVILLHNCLLSDTKDIVKLQEAIIDHELCHIAIQVDGSDAGPKYDGHERVKYRVRRHDLEEFREIIERHGAYKEDVGEFANTVQETLFDEAEKETA
jgi:hypothetical protein